MQFTHKNETTFSILERVNKRKLELILSSWRNPKVYDVIMTHERAKNDADDQSMQNMYNTLERYYNSIQDSTVEVSYQQNGGRGRHFSRDPKRTFRAGGFGIQSMTRPVRHSICEEYYFDIDIENAHPTFAYQYAVKHGLAWKVPHLQEYVSDRKGVFKKLEEETGASKDLLKRCILTMMNGGDLKESLRDNIWLVGFYNEMTGFLESIKELNPAIKGKEGRNELGSIANRVWCDIENECLFEICRFFVSRGVEVGPLCFDGLLVGKSPLVTPTLLQECSEEVARKIGWNIKLAIKPMGREEGGCAMDLSELPTDKVELWLKDQEDHPKDIDYAKLSRLPIDESVIANLWIENNKDRIILSSKRDCFFFDSPSKLWARREPSMIIANVIIYGKMFVSEMSKYISSALFNTPKEDPNHAILKQRKKELESLKIGSGRSDKVILDYIRNSQELVNPTLLEKIDTVKDHLPIKPNRVVNLRTGETRERRKDDYFSVELNVSLETTPEKEEFIRNFFQVICGKPEAPPDCKETEEKVIYLQTLLGSLLTAETFDSSFYVFTGTGANGKSLVVKVVSKVLGPFAKAVPESLVYKKSKPQGVEKLSLHKKRFLYLHEVEKGEQISSTIKSIATGDEIDARGLYKECQDLKITGKLVVCTNHNLNIGHDDGGFKRRVKNLEFSQKFYDKVPEGSEEVQEMPVKDPMLEEKILQEYSNELFKFLLSGSKKYFEQRGIVTTLEISETNSAIMEETKEIDSMDIFLEKKLVAEAPSPNLFLKDIYKAYKDWWQMNRNNEFTPKSAVDLRKKLIEEKKIKTETSCRMYYIRNYKILE